MVSFGRDLIAEKNKRESIKSSIIKYWNVNYIDPKEQERLEEEKKMRDAQKVINRLEYEKAEDNAKKQAEIDQAYLEAELNDLMRDVGSAYYNAATGSYSGTYGQGEVDNVTKDQVQMILNEKSAALQNMIKAGNQN